MSCSSNPGSPDSLSMTASPSMSVTLSPQSMENLLGMPVEEQVKNNINLAQPYSRDQLPFLVVREQPIEKYRFRYKSEMMGSHGCMVGKSSDKRRKYFPSVELMNYRGTGMIRCSLYTAQKNESLRTLHCHRLVVKVGKEDVDDPHQIPVNPTSGYIAVFRGMGIIHTAKKHIASELVRKKRYRLLEINRAKNINTESLSQNDEAKIRAEAELEAKTMNLNVVTLGFEALAYDDNGILVPVCKPVFSEYICNMKSALTGELKICRIDRHFSTCVGGDEVWMLVEKVGKKNIKVKFYEMDDDDNEIWSDFGKFTELDVHHQYAIVFRTPPYRSHDIEEPRDVLVQLYRPTDGGCSEPVRFTYRPSDKFVEGSRKRPRISSGEIPLEVIINNELENGFNFLPPNSLPYELRDKTSNPLLASSDNSIAQPDTDLLREIDMLSVNSTTIEQLLNDKEGLESAEFKEFMQNLSLDGYLGTYNMSESMEIVTDSAKSKNTRKVVRSKPKATSQPKSITPPTIEDPLSPVQEVGEVRKVSASRPLSGDQLLEIVVKRLTHLMAKRPLPSSASIAESIRDLFEKTSDEGDCALHIAVKPENKSYLDKILSVIIQSRTIESNSVQLYISGILDARNKKRETPLHRAVFYNQPATVTALLLGGACANIPDINGFTPLHIAVVCSYDECLKQLLNKANYKQSQGQLYLNIKSEDGFSPLHLATRKRNLEAVNLLVSAGADVNETDQSYGRTALHIAVEEESAEILKFLVSQPGIQVNEPNFDGNTALHMACVVGGVGSLELCKLLVEAKANPRIPNYNVDTNPGEDAGKDPSSSTLVIVKQELDEVVESRGQTAFDLAAENETILAYLRDSELTARIKAEPEDEYDLFQSKEERRIASDLFDRETLSELCTILDRTGGWKRLAQLMDLLFLVASITNTTSPSRLLFNYADVHGNLSVERIREFLSILDENEAVKVIDEMLTHRFIAANNT